MEDHNITSSPALQTYYMNRILDITSDMGKRTFVWQEVFDNGGNLRKDAIVHVWKNGGNFHEEVMAVTSAGTSRRPLEQERRTSRGRNRSRLSLLRLKYTVPNIPDYLEKRSQGSGL